MEYRRHFICGVASSDKTKTWGLVVLKNMHISFNAKFYLVFIFFLGVWTWKIIINDNKLKTRIK